MHDQVLKATKEILKKTDESICDIRLSDFCENKSGFNNEISIFNLIYKIKDRTINNPVVYRKSIHQEKNASFSKEVEVMTHSTLKEAVMIPEILFEDQPQKILIMEKITGHTLDQYCLMFPDKKEQALKEFGRILSQIHSVEFENQPLKTVSDQSNITKYLNRLEDRVKAYDPIYSDILKTISSKLSDVAIKKVFCHCDYHFMNTIMTEDDHLFVLDWEKSTFCDYRIDIANTLILTYSWYGIDFEDCLIDGYEDSSGVKIDNLDVFKSLLSFDLLTRLIGIFYGASDDYIVDKSYKWLKVRYDLFVKYNGVHIEAIESFFQQKLA